MASGELYIPQGLLEVSKSWQDVIDAAPSSVLEERLAQQACSELQKIDGFYGTQHVIVSTESAIILRESYQGDELWAAIEFKEVVAKGWLGRIALLDLNGKQNLIWPIYDAKVINTETKRARLDDIALGDDEARLPTDRIRKPLYLPVSDISYAICAA